MLDKSVWRILGIALLFLIGTSACLANTPGMDETIGTTQPTIPPNLPRTFSPLSTPRLQLSPSTISLQKESSDSAISTQLPANNYPICSPLKTTPLADLEEIVSDGYHPPPAGQDGRHQGVDFAYYRKYGRESIAGEDIQAILGGRVSTLINDRFPYGNAVILEIPDGQMPIYFDNLIGMEKNESLYILYAHLNELKPLNVGDSIVKCQLLGKVGKSGNAGTAHLHLEMRIGKAGQVFTSMAYYTKDASEEERDQYLIWRTSGLFRHFDPMLILRTQQTPPP